MSITKVLTIVSLLLFATTAYAETRPMWVSKGIMCDTQEDLQTYLTLVHLNGGQFPAEHNTTCGMFQAEGAIPMLVTPVGEYETPSVRVVMAHFFHPPSGWEQYGYISFEPVEQGEDA